MSTLHERFWPKVRMTSTCWIWTAATAMGYGRIRGDDEKILQAHRVAYELLVGPIPAGLQLDHLCRDKRCVNPQHLEPVTQRENLLRADTTIPGRNARKTHCLRGHEMTPENTVVRTRREGGRECRACRRERRR